MSASVWSHHGWWRFHMHLPREPVYHHGLLRPRETDRLFRGVDRLVKAAGVKKLIQFVSFPLWSQLAVRLKSEFGFPIVYDCHDLLSGFRDISSDIIAAEPALMESADLVCFSSRWRQNETARPSPEVRKTPERPPAARPSDAPGGPARPARHD